MRIDSYQYVPFNHFRMTTYNIYAVYVCEVCSSLKMTIFCSRKRKEQRIINFELWNGSVGFCVLYFCLISNFHHEVIVNRALLCYCAASRGNFVLTFRGNLRVRNTFTRCVITQKRVAFALYFCVLFFQIETVTAN